METRFELRGLAAVAWSSLRHAYGETSGTAGDLRALTAADPETQLYGIGQLEMSICHQGTLYSATVAAVPFLIKAAEQLEGGPKEDLLLLIAEICRSASIAPGHIAEMVHLSWSIWPNADQPNSRETALETISTYRAVLAALMDDIERLSVLLAPTQPALCERMRAAAQLSWTGDFLSYVRWQSPSYSGVANAILAEAVTSSYRTVAKKWNSHSLSATSLWWALEQELSRDEPTLFRDSLARDVNEQLRMGWKTGKHHERQAKRLWEVWGQRFLHSVDRTAKVRQYIELQATAGWLPKSRDDVLIRDAIEFAFRTE